jgi:CTP-dependent riboflavin kinase
MNMNRGDREKQNRLQLEAAALAYRPADIVVLECLEEATVSVGLAGVPVKVLSGIIAQKYPDRQVHNNVSKILKRLADEKMIIRLRKGRQTIVGFTEKGLEVYKYFKEHYKSKMANATEIVNKYKSKR